MASTSPPPNWDPNKPDTLKFINPSPGPNGAVFEIYAESQGEWHIYPNNQKVWVEGGEHNFYESVATQNAAGPPLTPPTITPPPAGGSAPPPNSSEPPVPPGSVKWDNNDAAKFQDASGQTYQVQYAGTNGEYHVYENGPVNWIAASGSNSETSIQNNDISVNQAWVNGHPVGTGGTQAPEVTSNTVQPNAIGAAPGDHFYKVHVDDNLSGIVSAINQENGNQDMTVAKLAAENQIANPSFIRTNDEINIGSNAVPTDAEVAQDSHPNSGVPIDNGSPGQTTGVTGGTSGSDVNNNSTSFVTKPIGNSLLESFNMPGSQGVGSETAGQAVEDNSQPGTAASLSGISLSNDVSTMGFPEKSSYPFAPNSSTESTVGEQVAQTQGWAGENGTQVQDVAKNIFEADTQTNTDPLKIDDKK